MRVDEIPAEETRGEKQATTYEKVNPKGPPVNEGRGNEQNMQTVGERKTCEI